MLWPMYDHVERRARRLHDMIERLGVDAVTLARLRQGDAYAEAREQCLHCVQAGDCLHFLADCSDDSRPEFCPNLALLESLKTGSGAGKP